MIIKDLIKELKKLEKELSAQADTTQIFCKSGEEDYMHIFKKVKKVEFTYDLEDNPMIIIK